MNAASLTGRKDRIRRVSSTLAVSFAVNVGKTTQQKRPKPLLAWPEAYLGWWLVPRDGREPACWWASFSVPFVLKFLLLYWFMLVIVCVCLSWLLHSLLHCRVHSSRRRFFAELVMILGTWCLAACGSAYGNRSDLFLGMCGSCCTNQLRIVLAGVQGFA
jgi:hypothetical protein